MFLHGFANYCVLNICFFLAVSNTFSQTFDDPTKTSQDNFGYAVEVDSSRVLVGDRRDDSTGTNVGQAHLFSRQNGQLLRTFNDPSPTIQDNFGSAIDFESNLVVIGAPLDATNGPLTGHAYLFDASNGQLLETFSDPTITQADFFGTEVAISGDRVFVTAPGDDTLGVGIGQVHVFEVDTGNLVVTINDPTPTGFDSFGGAIAVDGNFVVVGESGDDTMGFNVGQAHLFDASSGQFIRTFNDPTITESDSFGAAVSIHGDVVLIGAPGDDTSGVNTGEAYLFDVNSGQLIGTLSVPFLTEEDAFGASVSISGGNAAVGSTETAIGRNKVGRVYVLDQHGALRQLLNSPNGNDGDEFGFSISASNGVVFVGSPNDDSVGENNGRVYSFEIADGILGDTNGDGSVDLLDIAPFVAILTNGEYEFAADINADGAVDLLDIALFVALLSSN